AVLRALMLAKGVLALELAPAIGTASVCVLATWAIAVGLPSPVPGLIVIICALLGVSLAVTDLEALRGLGSSIGARRRLAEGEDRAATSSSIIGRHRVAA